MTTKWGAAIAVYAGVAVIIGVATSSVNMPRFVRLKNDGRQVQAIVSRTECGNHATIVSTFEVAGVVYEARGTDNFQNPQCSSVKTGDNVLAYYLPADPNVNVLGDIHERWNNEVASIIGAMVILPLVPAAGVWWRLSRRAPPVPPNRPLERPGMNASRPAEGASAGRSAPRR